MMLTKAKPEAEYRACTAARSYGMWWNYPLFPKRNNRLYLDPSRPSKQAPALQHIA
jgi:hypothetical protein